MKTMAIGDRSAQIVYFLFCTHNQKMPRIVSQLEHKMFTTNMFSILLFLNLIFPLLDF